MVTSSSLLISMPGGVEWLLILVILLFFFYWIKTIIDVANARFESTNMKIFWLVLVVVLGVLGAFIYQVAGRGTRTAS